MTTSPTLPPLTGERSGPYRDLRGTDQRNPVERKVDRLLVIADDWSAMTEPYLIGDVAAVLDCSSLPMAKTFLEEAAGHIANAHLLDGCKYDLIGDYLDHEEMTGDDDRDSETARDKARDIARDVLLTAVLANEDIRTFGSAA